jgi:subtilisin family serine protease
MIYLFALIGLSTALKLSKVDEPVQDEYVIQFKNNVTLANRETHMDHVNVNSTVFKRYDFPGFAGYAARMQPGALADVLASPHVLLVEQNGVMRISDEPVEPMACQTQSNAPWGLGRTTTRDLSSSRNYVYEGTLSSVVGYVIDTGIYIQHNDFGGRAVWGYNAVDSSNSDGNGHGTHCAGTMAGSSYGLHKTGSLKAVKVLNAGGSGTTAGVIDGVNWVVTDAQKMMKKAVKEGKAPTKAVANILLVVVDLRL